MPRDEQSEYTVVALDTEASSRSDRTDPIRLEMEDALGRIVEDALKKARLRFSLTKTGDGMYIALPAKVPPVRAVEPLVRYIGDGLRWHNEHYVQELARIRLRIAVDLGGATLSGDFVRGPTLLTAVTRLVEAPVLREALKTHRRASHVLLVSDDYYRRVIQQGFPGLEANAYEAVQVTVKDYRSRAWLQLPGKAPTGRATRATSPSPDEQSRPEQSRKQTSTSVQQRGVLNFHAPGSRFGDIRIENLRGPHDVAGEPDDGPNA